MVKNHKEEVIARQIWHNIENKYPSHVRTTFDQAPEIRPSAYESAFSVARSALIALEKAGYVVISRAHVVRCVEIATRNEQDDIVDELAELIQAP